MLTFPVDPILVSCTAPRDNKPEQDFKVLISKIEDSKKQLKELYEDVLKMIKEKQPRSDGQADTDTDRPKSLRV
jgi:hypothetical protein